MWGQVILAAISAAPDIIYRLNELFGSGRGPEKHAEAVVQLRQVEGSVPETPELRTRRDALIAAQVAYANELQLAASTNGN